MPAPSDYPHVLPIATRWKDNDVYGHVNNVEYYSYFDTVINAFLIREGGDNAWQLHLGEPWFPLPRQLAGQAYTVHSVLRIKKPFIGIAPGNTISRRDEGDYNVVENKIDIESITEPMKIFEGSAREAAKGFPANLNVAVALSLAGIGPDATTLQIWADPALTRNVHRVEVDSDSARFSMQIENIPSENPKTGRITALSVIALLRKRGAALRVGT